MRLRTKEKKRWSGAKMTKRKLADQKRKCPETKIAEVGRKRAGEVRKISEVRKKCLEGFRKQWRVLEGVKIKIGKIFQKWERLPPSQGRALED